METPAHALLERRDLREGRARHYRKGHIAMGQVNGHAVEVIGQIGAAGAAFAPSGAEHEVVDNELAAIVEEVGECLLAARAFEDVRLFDALPGKFAALAA